MFKLLINYFYKINFVSICRYQILCQKKKKENLAEKYFLLAADYFCI
jgi:hypothetical protein